MSGEFHFPVSKARLTITEIIAITNEIKIIQSQMEECVQGAKSAWQCGTADSVLGELGKAVRAGMSESISLTAGISNDLIRCSGNYTTNEDTEQSITDKLLSAFS